MLKLKMIFVATLLCATSILDAKIKMPKIFGDNMMLQRDMPVAIWGLASPDAEVRVEFKGNVAYAKAGDDGKWRVLFDAMSADFKPAEMKIFENDKLDRQIKNILVGEVWIIGGQSNMEWRVKSSLGYDKVKARANYPAMRYFFQPSYAMSATPQSDSHAQSLWFVCSPKTIEHFSGVGFFFAEEMLKDLKVPVALIYAACGATEMSAWIPREFTSRSAWLANYVKAFDLEMAQYSKAKYANEVKRHKAFMDKVKADEAKAKAEGKKAPNVAWDLKIKPNAVTPRLHFRSPMLHYNGKVAPVAGFSARGILWYQGESDARSTHRPQYEPNFRLLIEAWRHAFNNAQMPFIFVQLPSFNSGNEWAKVRLIQEEVANSTAGVYMACLIDCGEKHDIHPRDKATVGARLYKVTANKVYGKNVACESPALKDVKYDGARAELSFETFGAKLEARGEPRGFEVFVKGKWSPAKAKFANDKVEVFSSDGAKIEGVRYLYSDWARPDVWLFNDVGLPALPFSIKK